MAPGLNTTDPLATSVHGANPQTLIENITRQKIYGCLYWKESCFGLDAEGVLERAVELKYLGSTVGPSHSPSPMVCLALKLLQISPDPKIIHNYIKDGAFKYLRALGCFYLRLTGSPLAIYTSLEPCLKDYRKLVVRVPGAVGKEQWKVTTVDAFVEELLTSKDGHVLGIQLPRLCPRSTLEESSHFKKKGDKKRDSELRGDKRVKEIAKHRKRVERIEMGVEKEGEGEERAERRREKRERTAYGTLFHKGAARGEGEEEGEEEEEEGGGGGGKAKAKEGSDEYWNEERARLGLAPLRK